MARHSCCSTCLARRIGTEKTFLRTLKIVAFAAISASPMIAVATEYIVEFDIGPVGGVNGRVVRSHLSPSSWTTVGHRLGSTLENLTGDDIVAIWMRVPDGEHQFTVGPAGGGAAFGRVFRKRNGSELLFLDGRVPRGGFFWNRVVPRNTTNPFRGQAFHPEQDPPPPEPNPEEWELVWSDESRDISPSIAWQGLDRRMARNIDGIRAYADLANPNRLVWLSERGFPYVYDVQNDRIDPVIVGEMYPADVDHIAAAERKDGSIQVVLSKLGHTVAQGMWEPSNQPPIPEKVKTDEGGTSRIYFSGPNVFDLKRGAFVFTLFDMPAAVSFPVKATFLRKDKTYFYFKSDGVSADDEIEWAFTIEPSGSFNGRHRVRRKWSQGGNWEELPDPVYMTIPLN